MSPPTRYRRLRVRMWLEPTFRALSDADRLVAFYLLTGPQTNAVGLYRLSTASAAEDLGIPAGHFRRRLDVVLRAFGWRYEVESSLLWIPGWVEENAPQNPNICRSWWGAYNEIPDSPLKADAATATLAFLRRKGPSFAKAFGEPIPESSSVPFPEPYRHGSGNTPVPDSGSVNDSPNHLERRLANAEHTRQVVSRLQQRRGLA